MQPERRKDFLVWWPPKWDVCWLLMKVIYRSINRLYLGKIAERINYSPACSIPFRKWNFHEDTALIKPQFRFFYAPFLSQTWNNILFFFIFGLLSYKKVDLNYRNTFSQFNLKNQSQSFLEKKSSSKLNLHFFLARNMQWIYIWLNLYQRTKIRENFFFYNQDGMVANVCTSKCVYNFKTCIL